MADVQPEAVQWLWPGYLPLGKLVILDGDPELGKSTLALDLAARVSRGLPMPDGSPTVAGGVVLLSAEDGAADTVRPRLDAAGADCARIVMLQAVRDDRGQENGVTLPDHIPALREAIVQTGARLVIVDTFTAYLAGYVNSRVDHDVRRTLAPLARLAEEAGATIVLIRHLNKTAGSPAIYRGGGSIAIIGAARMGLLVARDPDAPESDDSQRVFAVIKSNLAPKPAALTFMLTTAGNGVGRIKWGGASTHRANELVALPATPDERHERDEAADFLRDLLDGGAQPTREVRKHADAAGLAWATVRRACRDIGVQAEKQGFGAEGKWMWRLTPKTPTPPHTSGVSILGVGEHLSDATTTYDLPKVPTSPKVLTGGGLGTLACVDCGDPCEAWPGGSPRCIPCAVKAGNLDTEARRLEREAIQAEDEAA